MSLRTSDETILLVFDKIITSKYLEILSPVVLIRDEALFLVLDILLLGAEISDQKLHLQIKI